MVLANSMWNSSETMIDNVDNIDAHYESAVWRGVVFKQFDK